MKVYTIVAASVLYFTLLIILCDCNNYKTLISLSDSKKCVNDTKPCGDCGPQISVVLVVENHLVNPYFWDHVLVNGKQRQLIYFLQEAATISENFRFSADYFGGLGYLITTMNQLRANFTLDESWWAITDWKGTLLPCGVSSYIPDNHETIIFNYVRGSYP